MCHLCGYILFLKGFFPAKVALPGHNLFESEVSPFLPDDIGKDAQFDRVVVMVVDAMRSDFMFSSSMSLMSFVHSMIEQGLAIPFTAYAHPPTVTLPRLKGLTTGSAPNFIDAVLNVADDKDSSQALSNVDSWLYQFKSKNGGKNLHFFGDDTWLKLFPPDTYFDKYDGTNSFFVSDFTEVDNNVTRHLDGELADNDWDALIVHYLGLDHIGHKGGPDSVYMQPKQKEMDSIIEKLYRGTAETSDSTLLVLLGDHGMNDIGNHGGSSVGETHPGMVFFSPTLQSISDKPICPQANREAFDYFDNISQIDLVPTLAALLNFPIPKNNLGVIIPSFLQLWGKREARNRVLLENCRQFMELIAVKYAPNDSAMLILSAEYEVLKNISDNETVRYYKFLNEIQKVLTESATNYSYGLIWRGFAISLFSCVVCLWLMVFDFSFKLKLRLPIEMCFFAFCIIYAAHFHGSSLIEEEHQLWWFFSILFFLCIYCLLGFKESASLSVCLVCIRVIRSWSNSGQKNTDLLAFSSVLLKQPNLLWALNLMTYFVMAGLMFSQGGWIHCLSYPGSEPRRFKSDDIGSLLGFVITYVVASLSFLFKLSQFYNDGNTPPVWLNFFLRYTYESFGASMNTDKQALQGINIEISWLFTKCMFTLLMLRIVLGKVRNIQGKLLTDIFNMLVLYLLHQSRVETIPIFLVFTILKYSFARFSKQTQRTDVDTSIISILWFAICIQNLAFFSVGNTNLLATVDLSNAYNGISSYDVIVVAILTFVSNFAVAIYWSLGVLEMIFGCSHDIDILSGIVNLSSEHRQKVLLRKCVYSVTFYSISAVSLVASCINLRYHLFIWSVFSPKLLYFLSWTFLMNFTTDFVMAYILIKI